MKIPAQSFIVVGALALAGCDPAPPTIAKSPVSPESAIPLVKEKVDSDVEKRVRRIVVEQLGLAPEKVSLASKFVELGADSLDFVELVMAFEEEFSVSIPDERAENLKTVGDAVVYLSRNAK